MRSQFSKDLVVVARSSLGWRRIWLGVLVVLGVTIALFAPPATASSTVSVAATTTVNVRTGPGPALPRDRAARARPADPGLRAGPGHLGQGPLRRRRGLHGPSVSDHLRDAGRSHPDQRRWHQDHHGPAQPAVGAGEERRHRGDPAGGDAAAADRQDGLRLRRDAAHGKVPLGLADLPGRGLRHSVSLPRTSYRQFQVGRRIARSDLRVGDLVFYYGPTPSHVGLYAGSGQIIHAPRPGKVVQHVPIDYMPYARAIRPG